MFNLYPDMKPSSSHSYCETYNNLNMNEDWLAEYVLALVFLDNNIWDRMASTM